MPSFTGDPTRARRRTARRRMALPLAGGVAGLLVVMGTVGLSACAATPKPGLAPVLAPGGLPHQGALAAGWYGVYRGQTRVGTDSFWVFQSRTGGRVLHSERALSSGVHTTTWLAVDSTYRPVAGSVFLTRGTYRCAVEFGTVGDDIRIRVTDGTAARGTEIALRVPPRSGVVLDAALARGWSTLAAAPGFAAQPEIHLGSCGLAAAAPPPGLGLVMYDSARVATLTVAGHQIPTWLLRQIPDRATAAQTLLWLDVRHGLLVQAVDRSGETERLEWVWTASF